MAERINLNAEEYRSYIDKLRAELNLRIENGSFEALEGNVPAWAAYVDVCNEINETLKEIETMLTANGKDFETSMNNLLAADRQ